MKITLHPTPDRILDRPECPFCHHRNEYDNIEWEDYVEYPMLWCRSCGARAVLDPESYYTFNESLEVPPVSIEIPLLFIERACDSHMSDVCSSRRLTEEEMKLLTHSYNDYKRQYDPKVIEQLGLRLYTQDELDEIDHGSSEPDRLYSSRQSIMNVSVEINSYNVEEPAKPHTAYVDMSHDGVYVYLLVVKLDGTRRIVSY